MDGVGRLTAANGDVYQGMFRKNKYHGVGLLTKANGDTYLGVKQFFFVLHLLSLM
jgi:hypothetical protein